MTGGRREALPGTKSHFIIFIYYYVHGHGVYCRNENIIWAQKHGVVNRSGGIVGKVNISCQIEFLTASTVFGPKRGNCASRQPLRRVCLSVSASYPF